MDTIEQFSVTTLVNSGCTNFCISKTFVKKEKSISRNMKALSHATVQMAPRTKQEQSLTLSK